MAESRNKKRIALRATEAKPTGATKSGSVKQKNSAKFELLLRVFDLQKCYPQKLTLVESLKVRESFVNDSNICSNRKLFYIMVIKNILSFDCKCFLKLDSSAIGDIADELKTNKLAIVKKGKVVPKINPLDGLLTVLLCSDNFLRQDLMYRLATCQIAVPLVLPDPMTGELTLTLWSLRKIIKQWRDTKSHEHEVSIISYPTPVVSFVRFGTHKRSKSRLINIVINNSTHDTFFHYDCDGGSAPKFLAEGLIDMAWYIPSDRDSFSEPVTFLNLHGDALKLERQIHFLRDVCLMHFVLVKPEELDETAHQEVLQALSQSPGGVVLLQDGESDETELTSGVQDVIEIDSNNDAETKMEVWENIKNCIVRNWNSKATLKSKYADAARCCGIIVDEDDAECAKGISLAVEFEQNLKTMRTPKKLLVLQGAEYWHKIAEKEKEMHRQKEVKGMPVDEYRVQMHTEIAKIRRNQKKKIVHNLLVDTFLTTLSRKGNVRNYYLQQLKLLLHDFSCEKLLPLHKEYQRKKKTLDTNVKEIEKCKKDLEKKVRQGQREQFLKVRQEVVEKCKRELEQLSVKIMNASFGVEHLLREIGQMYEASTFLRSQKYNDLPGIIADLVIDGHPLELMDGDAAHVPIQWVSAVLERVIAKLNDPFVVPLTILGLQSSGKSTLLNTLFGVNFNVSAGRCTRGAFMQLLPFHSSVRKNCYFLLVDTEGLRAPQLDARETHHHDNQLATFVIGLAHFTVINIYGEVLADMNDILQTAVHAFLRMKEVKHLTTGVHFVHQNVTSKMASGKNLDARDKMKANLDKMTVVAAKEEGLEKEYTCFDDVLKFDNEKDVTYFPSLWYGNPPMAPVNPEYSAEARKLKKCLIECTKPCNIVFSDFTKYLSNLWRAILQENFIFSFKNTLEMSVFSTLDYQRSKWFFNFRKEVIIGEDNFETQIHAISGVDGAAEEKYREARKRVIHTVSVTYSEIEKEVERFFKEHAEREILINWQAETEKQLKSLHDELSVHAKQHCEQIWKSKKAKEKVNEIKHSHRSVILAKVKSLISHLEKGMLSESDLKVTFEDQWKKWIKSLNAQISTVSKPHDIEFEMQEALKDHFKKQLPTLIKKLTPSERGKPLQSWGERCEEKLHLQLEEEHIKRLTLRGKASKVASGVTFGWVGKDEKWRPLAEKETSHYLHEVEKYLMSKRNKDYNPSFITEIIILLQENVERFRCDMFEFTLEYRMDLTLTACGYALRVFQQMAEIYRDENDAVKCLEREKLQYFNDFCDEYFRTAKEITAARQCCELIERAIEKRVTKSFCLTVVQKMEEDKINSFLFTKRTLIKEVLKCIGSELKQRKFDTCSKYLRHPMETLQEYVKKFTESYCGEGHPQSRLTIYAEELIISNMKFVRKTLNEVNTSLPLRYFIEELIAKLSQRLMIEGTIRCEFEGSESISNFTNEVEKRLKIMQDCLKQKFVLQAKDMEKWDEKPYDMIFERARGCKEMCPFCHEPCNQTVTNHSGDHTVDLHRPNCLGGWRYHNTDKMCLKNCSKYAADDRFFLHPSGSDQRHPYRQCEKVFPKWHIQDGLPTEALLYWKYVVDRFKGQLARLYGMEEDDVPPHWEGIELSQAIYELR